MVVSRACVGRIIGCAAVLTERRVIEILRHQSDMDSERCPPTPCPTVYA